MDFYLLYSPVTINAATKLGFELLYIKMNLSYMEKQLIQLQECPI